MSSDQPSSPAPHAPQPAKGVHTARPAHAAPRPAQTASTQQNQPVVPAGLRLPAAMVSRGDVSRCLRELDGLNDYFHQAAVRGNKDQALPQVSLVLEGLAAANGANLLHGAHRDQLKSFLTQVRAKAPVVHMSFPSAASNQFIARIVEWFRTEVDSHTLLHVGLQPELAAGCTLRTLNKSFDFSFRKRFEQSKQKLMAAIEALDAAPERTVVAEATATVPVENQL